VFADTRPLNAAERAALAKPPAEDDENILVVDDSDTALRFMQGRLRRFGFQVELVKSGEEALERIAQRPFKFVFLDVVMGGMDGFQTCKAIKQREYPKGKEPIVVMLSSKAGKIDKLKGSMAGCDAYLAKPLEEGDLISVLARHHTQIQRGFQATDIPSDFRKK
jgi:two-component system cell cycle response regulator